MIQYSIDLCNFLISDNLIIFFTSKYKNQLNSSKISVCHLNRKNIKIYEMF